MATKTYNTLEGELTIRGAPTTSRSGSSNGIVIVGGYDSANADSSVTAGETTNINNPTSAEDLFGDSELPRMIEAASANGVGDIRAVPVPETNNTESFSSTQSFQLTETPVFNPEFHPDHSITVTDTVAATDLDVNIVYADSPSTPSESDTANVNPINGKIETDASSDFDVTYDYGDYSTAIDTAADEPVRYIVVGTEESGVKSTLVTKLSDIANDFDFKRGVVNAEPEIDSGSISSYTPNQQDWRLVESAPAIADGSDGQVRTCAAIGGFLASQPIGPDGSILFDSVNGITSVNKAYRPSDVKGFDGVTAITRTGVVGKAETTSTEEQFRLIYATEIIDDVALDLFATARSYAGGPQSIDDLETLLEVVCQGASEGSPPLLGFGDGRSEEPYDVNTSLGADSGTANAGVTIVPYPIAEEVNLSLTVSDGFIGFEGVN